MEKWGTAFEPRLHHEERRGTCLACFKAEAGSLIFSGLGLCHMWRTRRSPNPLSPPPPHTHAHNRHKRCLYLPQPKQLPPHSGWSKCCRRPICTERPERTESPSAPAGTDEQGGEFGLDFSLVLSFQPAIFGPMYDFYPGKKPNIMAINTVHVLGSDKCVENPAA